MGRGHGRRAVQPAAVLGGRRPDRGAARRARCVLIENEDQPGVIGDVGTASGRHGVNIANFALGRDKGGAVGVVNIDVAEAETGGSRTRTLKPSAGSSGSDSRPALVEFY